MINVNIELLEALKAAKTGLEWYQFNHPESVDGSDDEAMERIDAAIAAAEAVSEPVVDAWTIIAPDGTRFTGETPLKAALPASKYHRERNPVDAAKFLEIVNKIAEEGAAEREQCLRDYGTLDCPACGGSGHIADFKALQPPPAAPLPLSDEQIDKAWRSVDYTQPYEDFRIAIARAIEAAHNIGAKE